ncbi:MAG: hypothetical protein EXR95_02585 [Gemmatimonadetes bacterium]|nr:hypothetical protein [Gemmatimonadota bacterium]
MAAIHSKETITLEPAMRCPRSVLVPVLASTVALSSCSGKKEDVAASAPADTLTRRQRDSIIIKAKLPGAGAVGRAMGAADRASAKAAAHDSIERALR